MYDPENHSSRNASYRYSKKDWRSPALYKAGERVVYVTGGASASKQRKKQFAVFHMQAIQLEIMQKFINRIPEFNKKEAREGKK